MNKTPARFARTVAVIACTLLCGSTLLVGAVGPGMAAAPTPTAIVA